MTKTPRVRFAATQRPCDALSWREFAESVASPLNQGLALQRRGSCIIPAGAQRGESQHPRMEGRNDSSQSPIVLAEYRFRSVARDHMHAFCVRWLSQYAGWHHGAVASPISFTESDADAESDVAPAPASLKSDFRFIGRTRCLLWFHGCRRFGTLLG
jgi:hypothetical protein